jgi:hypothetical protein
VSRAGPEHRASAYSFEEKKERNTYKDNQMVRSMERDARLRHGRENGHPRVDQIVALIEALVRTWGVECPNRRVSNVGGLETVDVGGRDPSHVEVLPNM